MRNRRLFILVGILLLAIGFASVTTVIYLNGDVSVGTNDDDFDTNIIFSKAKIERGGSAKISVDKKSITFVTRELTKINEETKLYYTVTNNSVNYGAHLQIEFNFNNAVNDETDYSEYISYQFDRSEFDLNTGESRDGELRIKLLKATEEELNISMEVTITGTPIELNKAEKVMETAGCLIADSVTDTNPGEFNGSGTEENPYLIESIEDLLKLSISTNDATLEKNMYYKLTNNLDFKCDNSYVDYSTKTFGDINNDGTISELKEELTTGSGWIPIGNNPNAFSSNFDGNNKKISNLISSNLYTGLFGWVKVYNEDLSISNLSVDVINLSGQYISPIAAYTTYNDYKDGTSIYFSNNNVYGKVDSSCQHYGGIVGYGRNVVVDNCNSYVDAKLTNFNYAGGIAGSTWNNQSSINNSSNYGDIEFSTTNVSSYVGGIVGHYGSTGITTNLYNKGNLTGNASYIGGIIGTIYNELSLRNARNDGNIICGEGTASYIGGITGYHNDSSAFNLINTGNIESKSTYYNLMIGGIFGYQDYLITNQFIYNIVNTGNVKAKVAARAGGIAGDGAAHYKSVYNSGDVYVEEAYQSVGPLAGRKNYPSPISNFINYGSVHVKNLKNAIISGLAHDTYTRIENGFSIGDITIDETERITNLYVLNSIENENIYMKNNIKTLNNTFMYSKKDNNVYLDLKFKKEPKAVLPVILSLYPNLPNVKYNVEGTNYNFEYGHTELRYDFSEIDSDWFKNTVNLGDGFKYENGYYPQLYKVDINGNVTSELLLEQVKKPIE